MRHFLILSPKGVPYPVFSNAIIHIYYPPLLIKPPLSEFYGKNNIETNFEGGQTSKKKYFFWKLDLTLKYGVFR